MSQRRRIVQGCADHVEWGNVVAEHNDRLRRARERIESPHATGEPLSRQELAELVNAWVFEHQERVIELDANYIGKLEQGTIRWPREPDRRAAFRAVLGVATDAELGFRRLSAAALPWRRWTASSSSAPVWAPLWRPQRASPR